MSHAQITLPAATRSVAEARRFLIEMLSQWDAQLFEWTAATVVSELATNAVLHARTAFTLAVRHEGDTLRLEVADGSVLRPTMRRYGLEATTGRGLGLVQQLARAWGVITNGRGKTVWCELAAEPGATTGEDIGDERLDDAADLDALLAQFGEPVDEPARARLGRDRPRTRAA